MANICYPVVRGRRLRATRLDGCGNPVLGPDSTVVTAGFISVALTANVEEGEAINVTNANGDVCVLDQPAPKFTDYSVEITFCDVNPTLFNLMSGQPLVTNGLDTVGFRMNSEVDAAGSGFALELWTGVPSDACEVGSGQSYGYLLLPFLQGGVLGDFTIENAAINFVLTGARTKKGSGWGVGPYDVVTNPGTSEVQTITVTGTPTGGTFTLTYDGETTATIAYNAAAAAVKTALEALPNIDLNAITAGGGALPSTPVTITFGGDLAGTNVPQMTASASFTGGTSPAVAVTTTTPGAGVPGPLLDAITTGDHLHLERTTVAPPEADCEPEELGVAATTGVAGTPGTLTPANSYAPANFADLLANPLTASPNADWTAGQYITLRDGSFAHFNGTLWVAGAHA